MLKIGIDGLVKIGGTLLRVNSINKKFTVALVNELKNKEIIYGKTLR